MRLFCSSVIKIISSERIRQYSSQFVYFFNFDALLTQLAHKLIGRSIQFGTPHFLLVEFISDEAQPVPVQTPQQPQHSFHMSHPAGKQIFAAVVETMTTTGNGCKSGVSSHSAAANRWRGSDLESESPAPAALINHRVCTRPRPRATWKICSLACLCEAAASEREAEEEAEGF